MAKMIFLFQFIFGGHTKVFECFSVVELAVLVFAIFACDNAELVDLGISKQAKLRLQSQLP